MTATATAPTTTRKSLRHSQLRALGPVGVKLTSHPRASRFSGRGLYACMMIDGHGDTSFAFECEHAGIAAELAALPLGVWVEVVALGRDAAATVQRVDAPAPVAAPVAGDVARAADAAVELVAALRDRIGREPTPAEAVAYVILMASKF